MELFLPLRSDWGSKGAKIRYWAHQDTFAESISKSWQLIKQGTSVGSLGTPCWRLLTLEYAPGQSTGIHMDEKPGYSLHFKVPNLNYIFKVQYEVMYSQVSGLKAHTVAGGNFLPIPENLISVSWSLGNTETCAWFSPHKVPRRRARLELSVMETKDRIL